MPLRPCCPEHLWTPSVRCMTFGGQCFGFHMVLPVQTLHNQLYTNSSAPCHYELARTLLIHRYCRGKSKCCRTWGPDCNWCGSCRRFGIHGASWFLEERMNETEDVTVILHPIRYENIQYSLCAVMHLLLFLKEQKKMHDFRNMVICLDLSIRWEEQQNPTTAGSGTA